MDPIKEIADLQLLVKELSKYPGNEKVDNINEVKIGDFKEIYNDLLKNKTVQEGIIALQIRIEDRKSLVVRCQKCGRMKYFNTEDDKECPKGGNHIWKKYF